jgi:hypothetical protein
MRAVVIGPPPTGDTIHELTNDQLFNGQVLLTMRCTRNKATERNRRREYFCYLGRVLKVEADLRGLPSPPATATTADLKRA